jgi:transketolase
VTAQQEGQVWEAAMEAGHFQLDNLIGMIDCNRLQIDGWVKDVMEVEPLAAKYAAFGWDVLRIDGHNVEQVVELCNRPKLPWAGRPSFSPTPLKAKA